MSQTNPTTSTKPVTVEHQLYHCPDCGKMVATIEHCPLAPEKFVQLYRAKMMWCEKCRHGYVGIQKFNGTSWDFVGQQFQTGSRNYLESLSSRVQHATDPEAAIKREAGTPKVPVVEDEQRVA